jgi:hypothetical protein
MNVRTFTKLGVSLLAAYFQINNLCSVESDSYLDFASGYRYDEIRTALTENEIGGALLPNEIRAKNLSIYQVGLKGTWKTCSGFYLRGYADYGWIIGRSHYHETFLLDAIPSETIADIHRGQVADVLGGVGYLFSWSDCWGIGPVVGWSYDYQRIKMSHPELNGLPDPALDGLKYTNRWQGPWIGVDFVVNMCDFEIDAGYEYHWSSWSAGYDLAGPDVFGGSFSDRRHSHDAHGQVVYLDGRWDLCDCWNIGIGLKYQFWRAVNGDVVPRTGTFADIGIPITSASVNLAQWTSLSATFDIGYNF